VIVTEDVSSGHHQRSYCDRDDSTTIYPRRYVKEQNARACVCVCVCTCRAIGKRVMT